MTTVVGSGGVVTGVTGDGVCDVQPAKSIAAIQLRTTTGAYLSIQKNDPLRHLLNQMETANIFAVKWLLPN